MMRRGLTVLTVSFHMLGGHCQRDFKTKRAGFVPGHRREALNSSLAQSTCGEELENESPGPVRISTHHRKYENLD
jgi:hypothetical protein